MLDTSSTKKKKKVRHEKMQNLSCKAFSRHYMKAASDRLAGIDTSGKICYKR